MSIPNPGRRNGVPSIALWIVPIALIALAGAASAAVTVYTDASTFAIDTNAGVVATFEGRPVGLNATFTEGGVLLAAQSAADPLAVIDGTYTNTHPTPTSHMLTCSGADNIYLTPPPGTYGIGFDTITNRYAHPTVRVYAPNGSLIFTYTLTQPVNTAGFVGLFSTTPIGKVLWQATGGDLENTALDNVQVTSSPVPVAGTTWGGVKSLFR